MFDIYHDENEIFNKCYNLSKDKISVKSRQIKFGFGKEDN